MMLTAEDKEEILNFKFLSFKIRTDDLFNLIDKVYIKKTVNLLTAANNIITHRNKSLEYLVENQTDKFILKLFYEESIKYKNYFEQLFNP